tara:strand:+ start:2530 stop:3333 length:804 start_codon:yes stop_codon:yes gene_type:complete
MRQGQRRSVMEGGSPPVAQLLRREAAAWESLLQLQTALTLAQRQALAPAEESDGMGHSSPHSRAYLSSLTHLAACGDALVAEALKLRSLRSARDAIESSMYRHVVLQHQQEFFKCGESESRSVTNEILQATSDVRNEVARARAELTQLRSALEALDGIALRLPAEASVVIGLRYESGANRESAAEAGEVIRPIDATDAADACEATDAGETSTGAPPPLLQTLDEFLRRCLVHSDGSPVTDQALAAALLQSPPPADGEQQNRFRRRKT